MIVVFKTFIHLGTKQKTAYDRNSKKIKIPNLFI